ncbi:MAG: hypothetical protein EXR98_03215 [Gemmataceae bacterium]|nr:hypothetical protein [Gemmataceae bacterium]
MSQPEPSDRYPNAILVTPSSDARKKKTQLRKASSGVRLPWVQIAIGGGIGWVLVVLIVAGFSSFRGERPIEDEPLPMPAIRPVGPRANAAPKAVEPAAPQELKPLQPEEFVDCDQIGTQVRFLKDPAAAFQRAAAEKKMVFMMHLSGNLEDKDFT